jgi:hypothetical protein
MKPRAQREVYVDEDAIEEDRTHYADGDMLSFVIAAACEKKTVVVTHKPSKTEKIFKNKTEFQGRSKKTLGGWLGDLNKSRVERDQKPFELKEFILEEKYEADSIENCLHSVKQKIKSIEKHLGQQKTHIVMGTGENFRHKLLMPKKYKWNREGSHKPLLLNETREYLTNIKKAEVCTGIEADDQLSIYQYNGHLGFLETGKHTTIVSCVDKDARSTDGQLNNPTTSSGGKFVYPEPLIINGLGELYLTPKGEPKGHGRAWLYYQILFGDPTDGYSPTDGLIKGYGKKSAFDDLVDCKTDKEYWERIVEVYHDWFPTGLQYEAWEKTEMDIKPVEWMQMQATCAFMQRWKDDSLDVRKVLDKFEITYD